MASRSWARSEPNRAPQETPREEGPWMCSEHREGKWEEGETDGPILYEKAEREDVTWESPQNKPSVRCKA